MNLSQTLCKQHVLLATLLDQCCKFRHKVMQAQFARTVCIVVNDTNPQVSKLDDGCQKRRKLNESIASGISTMPKQIQVHFGHLLLLLCKEACANIIIQSLA